MYMYTIFYEVIQINIHVQSMNGSINKHKQFANDSVHFDLKTVRNYKEKKSLTLCSNYVTIEQSNFDSGLCRVAANLSMKFLNPEVSAVLQGIN